MITTATVKVTSKTTGKSATATASCSVPIHFGVNSAMYSQVAPSLPGVTFTKWFAGSGAVNGIPPNWPTAKQAPAGCTTMACINPDPVKLLAAGGPLDGAVAAFLGGAKSGDWVTGWQEWNIPSNSFWSVPGATISMGFDVHGYMAALVQRERPDLKYVIDFGTAPVQAGTQTLADYVPPGWTGLLTLDGYMHQAGDTAASVFGTAWDQVLGVVPEARPAITETNSSVDMTGAWFTSCFSWLVANAGILFATWWGPGTHFSMPFDPSQPYVAALQSVSQQCAA